MKKSIKYAGVAAATLLAVAPVAAPVLTNVTTVQAADSVADTTKAVQSAADAYTSGLTNKQNVALPATTTTSLPGYANGSATMSWDAYVASDFYTKNNKNITADQASTLSKNNALVTVSIDGAQTADDLALLDAKGPVKATITISGYGKDATSADSDSYVALTTPSTSTVSYSIPSETVTDENTSAAATYDDSINATYTDTVNSVLLSSSANFAVKGSDGNALKSATAVPATTVYPTYNDALNSNAKTAITLTPGQTFKDAGLKEGATYYQKVTATATAGSDFATLLGNYVTNNATGKYSLTLNDKAAASTDATVAGTADTGTAAKPNNDAAGSVTYIRAINLGTAEEAAWTTKDESGVVTTKTDKTYYTLKNDDNKTISNRALAANTAWQYDKTRTNANGDVQYRVSTHEWVPAESVTVNGSDDNNGGTTTPEGALTVTPLATKKVVNLATPGMTYFVYSKAGVMSDTRALAGGSSWLVDKTATDAAGNTYYGVSSDEFVKAGEGVSLAD